MAEAALVGVINSIMTVVMPLHNALTGAASITGKRPIHHKLPAGPRLYRLVFMFSELN